VWLDLAIQSLDHFSVNVLSVIIVLGIRTAFYASVHCYARGGTFGFIVALGAELLRAVLPEHHKPLMRT
jgi:hypothetical protein